MRSNRTSRQLVGMVAALCVAGSALVAGQSSSSALPPKPSAIPRTPDGKPDLQGVWDFRTITPMERPKELANKATLTEEEARQLEIQNRRNQDNREKGAARTVNGQESNQDVERAYNDFWWDFGTNAVKTRRTSLVVDPSDGRIPALTDAAQKRGAERRARGERLAEGPEDRNIGERCILGFNAGPPMLPSAYNNNVQIVQTKDYVLIHNEMVHNARVVPLVSKTTPNVPTWNGDSRARWEATRWSSRRKVPRPDVVPELEREASTRRAVHAHRRRHADVSIHRQRPDDVDQAVDRGGPDGAIERADVRVRLPRGELRHGEPAQGRALPREGRRRADDDHYAPAVARRRPEGPQYLV